MIKKLSKEQLKELEELNNILSRVKGKDLTKEQYRDFNLEYLFHMLKIRKLPFGLFKISGVEIQLVLMSFFNVETLYVVNQEEFNCINETVKNNDFEKFINILEYISKD